MNPDVDRRVINGGKEEEDKEDDDPKAFSADGEPGAIAAGPGEREGEDRRRVGGGGLGGGVRFGIKDDFGIVGGILHAFSLSIDTVYGSPFFSTLKNLSPVYRTGKGPS